MGPFCGRLRPIPSILLMYKTLFVLYLNIYFISPIIFLVLFFCLFLVKFHRVYSVLLPSIYTGVPIFKLNHFLCQLWFPAIFFHLVYDLLFVTLPTGNFSFTCFSFPLAFYWLLLFNLVYFFLHSLLDRSLRPFLMYFTSVYISLPHKPYNFLLVVMSFNSSSPLRPQFNLYYDQRYPKL